ncbi:MAG: AraC family transcriptional regulator [Propionicimonas sp.]|uniref:helix-turn-helix transcriptional regulator n=1 Tax=Propionicimonas sp. TaxID=1955623 RepID=UPI003D0B09F4
MTEFCRSSALPHLEARRSCQEKPCYRPHFHDTFSIGVVNEGASVFAGGLEGVVRLVAGDVIVIPAGHVHSCNPEQGRWLYQMIHSDQDWAAALAPPDAEDLFDRVSVLRRPGLPDGVGTLNDLLFADASPEILEEGFAALLAELAHARPTRVVVPDADPELDARLRPVLDRLRDDETNPALDELAGLVGMTTYQLVRAVRRSTGLSPLAWRQNARIIRARHLLREGHPIAETAQALGFADQSHFHRVFRAHVAASPGAYRS